MGWSRIWPAGRGSSPSVRSIGRGSVDRVAHRLWYVEWRGAWWWTTSRPSRHDTFRQRATLT
jgi:hypothetical protein